MEKIYFDQNGYNQYLQEIEVIREKIKANNLVKAEAIKSAPGDGPHDNFAFEDAKRQELRLMKDLEDKITNIQNIVIVDENDNENTVNVGDVINLTLKFAEDDIETGYYKLIGGTSSNLDGDVVEVSLNSSLGKSIYNKHVGEKTFYEVNDNKVHVEILGKKK